MTPIPSFDDRLRGAIWGQFVADAAALGTHWIYDLDELAARYPAGVQGFEPPRPGHYHEGKQSGDFTHYGDAALLLLESTAALGRFDERDFGKRFAAFFNDPQSRVYKDHATRETLAHLAAQPDNYQNGADDDQPATVSRLAPVVVAHLKADDDGFFEVAARCTRFAQIHPTALAVVKAHAVILRHLCEDHDLAAALEVARVQYGDCGTSDLIEAALSLQRLGVTEATLHFGQGCPLPKTFPSAIHAAVQQGGSYREAVLATLRAGGDNAARAAMIGAWLGALHGVQGIPEDWRRRLSARKRVHEAVEQLVGKQR